MGKTNNARFKRAQFSPDGVPVKAVKRAAEDEIDDEVESPHAELVEKVFECTCIFFFPTRTAADLADWLMRARACAVIDS